MRIVRCEAIPGLVIGLEAITEETEQRLFNAKTALIDGSDHLADGRSSFFQTLCIPVGALSQTSCQSGGLTVDDFRDTNLVKDSGLCPEMLWPNYVHNPSYSYKGSKFNVGCSVVLGRGRDR
jgi:hypothetical protein